MPLDKGTLDSLKIDRSRAPARTLPVRTIAIVSAVLLAAILILWWLTRPKPIVVQTAVAKQESSASGNQTLLNASGYVTARRAATVSSKVTGKVIEVLVEEGMKIDNGQIVARLDASNVEKSLQLAEAQLESAKRQLGETEANLDQARSELKRKTEAGRAISELELERVKAIGNALNARLHRQQSDVTVAGHEVSLRRQELEDTVIRSPFAGIVTSKDSQPGEMISPVSAGGGFTRTGICTVVDMSSLEIEVDVSESYINRVVPGMPVEATLDAYPAWKIPCKVIAIIPTADRQKATVKVRVSFDKLDPRILPDMSVKVAFQAAAGDAKSAGTSTVVIRKSAVKSIDGRDVVWVVRDGRVERRAITIGMTRGDDVTVAAGLIGGERVVLQPSDQLTDGATVTEAK